MSYRIDQIATTRVLPKATDYAEVGNATPESAKVLWANFPQKVDTIAALKALMITNATDGQIVLVRDYSTAGDGGGGLFRYSSGSVAAVNLGTIFAPDAGAGRWLRVYSGPVNARWFGAKGDAATDDATALQAAIDFSGTVFLPAGTYIVGAPLTLGAGTVGNARLFGEGQRNTILRAKATNLTAVIRNNFASFNIQLANLAIDGNNAAAYGVQLGDGVNLNAHIIFSECGFYQATTANIYFNRCQYIVVRDCQITDCNNAGAGIGVKAWNTADLTISGCQFISNALGFDVDGNCSIIRVQSSDFHGPYATPLGYARVRDAAHVWFTNCTFENEMTFPGPLVLLRTPVTDQTTDINFNSCYWLGISAYAQDLIYLENGVVSVNFRNCRALKPAGGNYILTNSSTAGRVRVDDCLALDGYFDITPEYWDDNNCTRGVNCYTIFAGYMISKVLSSVAYPARVALVTNTDKDVTSISIGPGRWLVSGSVAVLPSVGADYMRAGISLVSNNIGNDEDCASISAAITTTTSTTTAVPPRVIEVTAYTTVYLVAKAGFAAGGCDAWGRVEAVSLN